MSAELYPLQFTHVYKDYLWGGSRMAALYRRTDAPPVCAESWEISDRPEGMSIVRNGPHTGTSLAELVSRYGRALVGTAAPAADRVPLLIKLIDAHQRLSVQVHPDDESARRHGGEAKSEAWVMLDGQPDACIYSGWQEPMTEAGFRSLLAEGRVAQALRRVPALPGTAVYVPGGCVHAIGEGCLILEVQQNSNTTYRVDDWGRVGADGRPRTLHVEEAAKVIRWGDASGNALTPSPLPPLDGNPRALLVTSPYFRVERLDLAREAVIEHDIASFTALFVRQGAAACSAAGHEALLGAGDSCLIPAAVAQYTLRPAAEGAEVVLTRLG